MIQIDAPADYHKLNTAHPLIARHIKNYCNGLLQEHNAPDLNDTGSVFLLQTVQDLENHQALGLSQPLYQSLNELSEMHILKGREDTVKLLNVVYLINNSRAINVFMPANLPPEALKEHLYE